LGFLAGLWGLILEAFGRHLGPLRAVSGGLGGEASRTPLKASRMHPRSVQEAFQRPQTTSNYCRCYVLCFHRGQAECAKRLNMYRKVRIPYFIPYSSICNTERINFLSLRRTLTPKARTSATRIVSNGTSGDPSLGGFERLSTRYPNINYM
jgi:hypothetical protein